jgi:hypothetical protein
VACLAGQLPVEAAEEPGPHFDKRFVTPSSGGLLRFDDQGTRKGRCYLTCHGKNHNPLSY